MESAITPTPSSTTISATPASAAATAAKSSTAANGVRIAERPMDQPAWAITATTTGAIPTRSASISGR